MRRLFIIAACFFIPLLSIAQFEGDRYLDVVGMNTSDPLFQQLKRDGEFITDAWNKGFSIYVSKNYSTNIIEEIEFQNGKKKMASSDERYGFFQKTLPLQLKWTMDSAQIASLLGQPRYVSNSMGFKDYISNNWSIRIFFENSKPVSISFRRPPGTVASSTDTRKVDWLVRLDTIQFKAEVNWTALRNLIISTRDLKSFAGNDSVDYIGQVYYTTPYKAVGFDRTALKRKKSENAWHYESFLKMHTDSNKVREVFLALYDAFKKVMNENTGGDFILASSAKDPISKNPVNWMAQWTLYSGYKGLPPGIEKVKINLLLSGMLSLYKTHMEYTIKLTIFGRDQKVDFFTWDTPRG